MPTSALMGEMTQLFGNRICLHLSPPETAGRSRQVNNLALLKTNIF